MGSGRDAVGDQGGLDLIVNKYRRDTLFEFSTKLLSTKENYLNI